MWILQLCIFRLTERKKKLAFSYMSRKHYDSSSFTDDIAIFQGNYANFIMSKFVLGTQTDSLVLAAPREDFLLSAPTEELMLISRTKGFVMDPTNGNSDKGLCIRSSDRGPCIGRADGKARIRCRCARESGYTLVWLSHCVWDS